MAMFDPATGKVRDRDALRSVGFSGDDMAIPHSWVDDQGRKHEPVEHVDGGVAGEIVHHGDGRSDANVYARTVRAAV